MRRLAAIGAAVMLALAACDGIEGAGDGSPTPSASQSPSDGSPTLGTTPTSSPTTPPSATPSPQVTLRLPSDAPTTFDGTVTEDGPFEPLIPPGAEVRGAWFQEPEGDEVAFAGVAWLRGGDLSARELGFVLWERSGDGWRATHAFTDPEDVGLLGISLDAADVTGDGILDALTFEEIGGTGACGTWRVISPIPGGALQALRRQTCDAAISIVEDHLELREAVFDADDAHCCPSAFRTTTLEWNGERFVRTDVVESPAPSP